MKMTQTIKTSLKIKDDTRNQEIPKNDDEPKSVDNLNVGDITLHIIIAYNSGIGVPSKLITKTNFFIKVKYGHLFRGTHWALTVH